MEALCCKCGIPASSSRSKKEGPNKGKTFFGCGNYGKGETCDFFRWDAPPKRAREPTPEITQQPAQWQEPFFPFEEREPKKEKPEFQRVSQQDLNELQEIVLDFTTQLFIQLQKLKRDK